VANLEKQLILFMPSMEGGGVEKNIILISNYLSKNLKKIILITFDNKFNKNFSKKIKIINPNSIKNKKYSKYYKYFICLMILFKQILTNKNSLIFAFQANIYCIILSIFLNVPIIVRSNSSPTGWTNNFIKNFLFKFFFQLCNLLIVNSYEFKKEIDKKFNINSKVIYNPLNKKKIIEKSKLTVNFDFFKKDQSLKIINIARFTDQKDHLTLIKAFKILYKKINAKLLIIGYGANYKIMKNFIIDNNLNKKVKIIKFQENPYKYLRRADLFVLTSRYEGLPNVLLEAMTLKKFVISTDCQTGPKEILNNGKYGILFKIKDYKTISKKIIFFSKNKNKLKKKINLAYQSLERFDFNINCKKYLSAVQSLNK